MSYYEAHVIIKTSLYRMIVSRRRIQSCGSCLGSVFYNEIFLVCKQTQTEQRASYYPASERECFWIDFSFDSFSMINYSFERMVCVYAFVCVLFVCMSIFTAACQ